MGETSTISIPEIITISEETNLRLSRSNTFVPESRLTLGEKVKNIKLLSGEKFSITSSEKGSKRILVYTLETEEQLVWGDLNIEAVLKGSLNVDQIDYFFQNNKRYFKGCEMVAPVESDGRHFLIHLKDVEKGFYQEIDLEERLPDCKVKIFFAK